MLEVADLLRGLDAHRGPELPSTAGPRGPDPYLRPDADPIDLHVEALLAGETELRRALAFAKL